MAWGGGSYAAMNKILPGVYTKVSTAGAIGAVIGDRGNVAIPLKLTWGPDATVFKMTADEFYANAEKMMGANPMADSMKGIRDLFKYATVGYFYKLGTATKASNTFGDAKYGGTFGNTIRMVVSANADNEETFDVETYVGSKLIDTAVGVTNTDEMEDNDYVIWKSNVAFTSGSVTMSNGSDGTEDASAYSAWMTAIEQYEELHAIGCPSTDSSVQSAFISFVGRLVNNLGRGVQGVVYNATVDSEHIVNVKNSVDLIYWATGAIGGCAVNKSMTGKTYDGEFDIPADYTQAELEQAIKDGMWTLHRVGDDLKVLKDINSLTTYTLDKNKDLANNQVIRSINAFILSVKQSFVLVDLGNTANDASGRASVKSRIIDAGTQLLDIGAFSAFDGDNVTVSAVSGDKGAIAVNAIVTPAQAMDKMYLNLVVN